MHPIFLSIVLVVRNAGGGLAERLARLGEETSALASDYEIIVVDNSSGDETPNLLARMTAPEGLPNLQVFVLAKEVDADTASWAGVENSLGDFVAVIDPDADGIGILREMIEAAVSGCDVVFATNGTPAPESFRYRFLSRTFNAVFKRLHGINLSTEAPQFRVINRRVVNHILQHPRPAAVFRHLPASGGFKRANLAFQAQSKPRPPHSLAEGFDRGVRLLVSTTRVPMRLVTVLSLFGATANLLYSAYVIGIAIFKADVAPGWVTLSLQQSGMFFLLSVVLLVLGEYILNMASLSNEGPPYHVAQEFTSAVLTRRERLNVDDLSAEAGPIASLAGARRAIGRQ